MCPLVPDAHAPPAGRRPAHRRHTRIAGRPASGACWTWMQPVASVVHASLGNDDMDWRTAAACEEALALGSAGHSSLGPRPPPVLLSAAGRGARGRRERSGAS